MYTGTVNVKIVKTAQKFLITEVLAWSIQPCSITTKLKVSVPLVCLAFRVTIFWNSSRRCLRRSLKCVLILPDNFMKSITNIKPRRTPSVARVKPPMIGSFQKAKRYDGMFYLHVWNHSTSWTARQVELAKLGIIKKFVSILFTLISIRILICILIRMDFSPVNPRTCNLLTGSVGKPLKRCIFFW